MRQYNRGRGCRWDGVRGPYARPDVNTAEVAVQGAVYVGPCRCGMGPNAYYRTKNGRTVHATNVQQVVATEPKTADLDAVREEVERLTDELLALKKKLGEE